MRHQKTGKNWLNITVLRNNYSRVSTNPGEPSGFSDISMVSVFSWRRAGHVTHKYQALTDAL